MLCGNIVDLCDLSALIYVFVKLLMNKAFLVIIREHIQAVAGTVQLSTGQVLVINSIQIR